MTHIGGLHITATGSVLLTAKEVKEVEDHIDQLESENASLRGAAEGFSNENAKLCELVRAMWGCISHIGEYDVFYYDMAKDGCGISCTVNGEHCCADKLYDRMRELGVEL